MVIFKGLPEEEKYKLKENKHQRLQSASVTSAIYSDTDKADASVLQDD